MILSVIAFAAAGMLLQFVFEWLAAYALTLAHVLKPGVLNGISLVPLLVLGAFSIFNFRRSRSAVGFNLLGCALGCGGMFLVCSAFNGSFSQGV